MSAIVKFKSNYINTFIDTGKRIYHNITGIGVYVEHENRYGLRVLKVSFCQNNGQKCCSTSLHLNLEVTEYLLFKEKDELDNCFHFPLEDSWSTLTEVQDFRFDMSVSYESGEEEVQVRHWDIFYHDGAMQNCVDNFKYDDGLSNKFTCRQNVP